MSTEQERTGETWRAWGQRGVVTGVGVDVDLLFTVQGKNFADEQRYRDAIIADHEQARRVRELEREVEALRTALREIAEYPMNENRTTRLVNMRAIAGAALANKGTLRKEDVCDRPVGCECWGLVLAGEKFNCPFKVANKGTDS